MHNHTKMLANKGTTEIKIEIEVPFRFNLSMMRAKMQNISKMQQINYILQTP